MFDKKLHHFHQDYLLRQLFIIFWLPFYILLHYYFVFIIQYFHQLLFNMPIVASQCRSVNADTRKCNNHNNKLVIYTGARVSFRDFPREHQHCAAAFLLHLMEHVSWNLLPVYGVKKIVEIKQRISIICKVFFGWKAALS